MGTGVWVKQGSQDTADIYLNNKVQHAMLYLGLFTTDIDITDRNLTLADMIEPTASIYARIPLSPANWIVYGDVSVYPDVEFEVSLEPLGTIYGCFVTTSSAPAYDATGKLLGMNKFATPIVLEQYGDRVTITPEVTIT